MRSTSVPRLLRDWFPAVLFLFSLGCEDSKRIPAPQPVNEISYRASEDGEIWFRHSQIQLRFDNEMYCRVFFRKDGYLLSINDIPPDPAKARPPHYLEIEGTELKDFQVDYRNVGVSEIKTRFGTGKSLHLAGYATTPSGIQIEKVLTAEFYQEYPDTALLAVTYRNLEKTRRVQITKTVNDFFRLDASRTQSRNAPYAFQGVQGQPNSTSAIYFQITSESFSRTFEITSCPPNGFRTVPVLDLWNSEMGMAIGDISEQPQTLVLPVRVAPDQKVEISIQSRAAQELRPGELLATPKSLWMVHKGGMSAGFEKQSTLVEPTR